MPLFSTQLVDTLQWKVITGYDDSGVKLCDHRSARNGCVRSPMDFEISAGVKVHKILFHFLHFLEECFINWQSNGIKLRSQAEVFEIPFILIDIME